MQKRPKLPLTPAQIALYCAGYAVLVAGSGASAWVFRATSKPDLADSVYPGPLDTKADLGRLEYLGGKSNVLGAELQQGFAGLWHGRHLAYTLAVLAFAAAFVCFFTAHFLPDFPPPHPEGGPSTDSGNGHRPN